MGKVINGEILSCTGRLSFEVKIQDDEFYITTKIISESNTDSVPELAPQEV